MGGQGVRRKITQRRLRREAPPERVPLKIPKNNRKRRSRQGNEGDLRKLRRIQPLKRTIVMMRILHRKGPKKIQRSRSINGLLYVRGQHRDYDVWRQLGNKGWSWEDVLPYFIKAENQERGESEFHGVGGPLSVSDQRIQLPLLNEFQKAAEEFGIPKTKDFNTGDNHGCGYFQVTEKDGFRCSTAVGYLNPAKKRPNLKIVTKAHVKKINFENKVAKEVEYWIENEIFTVSANKEIVLSSGAIGSPQLLQVSGVGNSNKLKELGIEMVHELKGVGENLQDHLMFRPIYKIQNIKSLNKKINSLFGNLLIGLEYIFNRSGPMTMGASQMCMFAKSDPSLEA